MITARRIRPISWVVLGCLVWAALFEVAVDPTVLPATADLAANPQLLWGVRLGLPLLAGLVVPRRYRDWPAAAVLGTIGAVLIAITAITFAVQAIAGVLGAPNAFIAAHHDDRWSVIYPDGPPEPSQVLPIVLGIVISLVVGVIAWFAVAGVVRAGMGLRQLIGMARPSQRPESNGGSNSANSAG